MKVIRGIESVDPPLARSVLTIGNFDGMHRAHCRLFAEARRLAGRSPVVALTFEPHPIVILRPDHAPPRLTTLDQKLDLLADAGADIVVVARSDSALLAMPPEQFVQDVIIARFDPAHVIEGPSFRFGLARRGTPALLRELLAGRDCTVHELDPVFMEIDGEPVMVSSSLVRRLLTEGRVRETARALGRLFALSGTVVRGAGRGRTIGFPTANLEIGETLVPADGVYAGSVQLGDGDLAAAINVGGAPTFGDSIRRIEVHMPDYDGSDLHGQKLRIRFFDRLRDPQRFESAAALCDQLKKDVAAARRIFDEVREKGCADSTCASSLDHPINSSESPT